MVREFTDTHSRSLTLSLGLPLGEQRRADDEEPVFSEPFALPVIDPPRNALPLPPRLIDTLPLERVHAILGRHFEGLIKRFSVDDTEEEEVVEQENATSPRPSESSDTEAGGGGALSDSESSEALA